MSYFDDYVAGKPTALQMLSESYATKGVSKLGNRTAFGKDPQSTEGLKMGMTREENRTAQGSMGVTDPMAVYKEEEKKFKTAEQAYQSMEKKTDDQVNKLREDRKFWQKAKSTADGLIEAGKGVRDKDTGRMAKGAYQAAEALGEFKGPTGTATAIEGLFSGDSKIAMDRAKAAASQYATEKIVEQTIGRVTKNAAALGGASGAVAGLIQGQGVVESGVRGAASAGAAAVAAPLGPLASGAASFLADSVASLFFGGGEEPMGPQTKIGKETLGAPTAKEILTNYANA